MRDQLVPFQAQISGTVWAQTDSLGPTHVHGITPKMISMAPTFGEVASAIAKRIGNRVVVAHNLMFDERMLGFEFERMRAIFDPGEGICTLKLTKQKIPAACQMLGVQRTSPERANWNATSRLTP